MTQHLFLVDATADAWSQTLADLVSLLVGKKLRRMTIGATQERFLENSTFFRTLLKLNHPRLQGEGFRVEKVLGKLPGHHHCNGLLVDLKSTETFCA